MAAAHKYPSIWDRIAEAIRDLLAKGGQPPLYGWWSLERATPPLQARPAVRDGGVALLEGNDQATTTCRRGPGLSGGGQVRPPLRGGASEAPSRGSLA